MARADGDVRVEAGRGDVAAFGNRRARDAAGRGAFATPRHVWWNFVSSSRDRINQAKDDWRAGRFPRVPGDEEEFIPLPEVPKTVSYP